MSDAMELPERESMEFDVVIVGAGPAGLSAAIRLKQVNPELSVVVLEKGAEVGAHILSGAVVDPIGIDRLLPGWREEEGHPFKTEVTDDQFLLLGPAGSDPPAELPDAAADEQSRQLHRLARPCLSLAGRKGRGARRRDLSGLCRHRSALQRRRRRASALPPATWASRRTASRARTLPAAWNCSANTR